jgi:hypothetical protein
VDFSLNTKATCAVLKRIHRPPHQRCANLLHRRPRPQGSDQRVFGARPSPPWELVHACTSFKRLAMYHGPAAFYVFGNCTAAPPSTLTRIRV